MMKTTTGIGERWNPTGGGGGATGGQSVPTMPPSVASHRWRESTVCVKSTGLRVNRGPVAVPPVPYPVAYHREIYYFYRCLTTGDGPPVAYILECG
jgi:hypothetical protein